jgi:WD40 repeat protein
MESLAGRTLGDFLIREKLGAGGGGEIYRAEQPVLGRDVVIKILSRERGATSGEVASHFLEEARLASKLDHPFAAHIYAFGAESDGLFWIAMELVKGTTLAQLLEQRGPIALPRFVPLFERICEVVHSAHEQGIVHCDIKASNVMVVSRAGQLLPKLLDFGIAKLSAAEANGRPTVPDSLGPPIGSPHYMAPEQWLGMSQVRPATDLYALGILAFECLTGRLPFTGSTPMALARAHARSELPSFDRNLPEALYQTLVRATAKSPDARFTSALEFSAALRSSSSLANEELQLPQFDEGLRMALLTNAPQPIADAVSLVDSATTPRQLTAALQRIVDAVVRYLGLLALAGRARVGPGTSEDSAPVQELLLQLRQHELLTEGWLSLARELCRPFVFRREAHPIPELVDFFCGKQADAAGSPVSALAASVAPIDGHPTDAQVQERLSLVARVLEAIGFLVDYPLVARRGPQWQTWMGVSGRVKWMPGNAGSSELGEGQLALLDGGNTLSLSLWPLAQVMPPSPGAAEEIFLLSGEGRHGARLVSLPQGFERQDPSVWSWFGERIHSFQAGETQGEGHSESPYLGLSSFRSSDASRFFGREVEAEEFVNRLRRQHFLAVVGPSGAGKSSFVQAGVIPLVGPNWTVLIVRPGATPVRALVQELARVGISGGDPEVLIKDPSEIPKRIARFGNPVLLVVDQFEELLTLCTGADERRTYADLLMSLEVASENARLVLTMRDDFLIRIQQLGPLQRRLAPAIQLLGTPAKADLLRTITEPARRVGYHFDEPRLPEEMVDAVLDQPGALALLSFTASKLWELRDRHFQSLTRRAYQSLGGVGGALAHHAESLLAQMSEHEQKLVREAFRSLVTADGTRAVLRRHELLEILGRDRSSEVVLERLIGERLLVASEQGGSDDRVEVIHEALLSSWPRLVQWQREDAENARFRDQLRAAARQWEGGGRPRGMLWRRETLAEYKVWRARYPGSLTASERAFAEMSLRDEARGKRRLRGALVAVFVMLSVGIILLFRSTRRAEASEAEVKQRLAASHVDQGRTLLLEDRPLQALAYLTRAIEEGVWTPGLRYLEARATSRLRSQQKVLHGAGGKIFSLAISPDRKTLLLGGSNGAMQAWDTSSGRPLGDWPASSGSVWQVAFDEDGKRALGAGGGELHLVNVADGRELAQFPGVWAAFTSDGSIITLVGDNDGANNDVVLWKGAPPAKTGRWSSRTFIRGATLDRARGLLAVYAGHDPARLGGGSSDVAVLDASQAKLLFVLKGHSRGVLSAGFSPDGALISTASVDGTARLWSTKDGSIVHVLTGHEGPVAAIAWSPRGDSVATASDDGTARIWSAETGAQLRVLRGHEAAVGSVTYLDENHLATAGSDGAIRVWDVSSGVCLMAHFGHLQAITVLLAGPGNDQVTSASADGSIRFWDARARMASPLSPPDVEITRGIRIAPGVLAVMDKKKGWLAWETSAEWPQHGLAHLTQDPLVKFSSHSERAVVIGSGVVAIDLADGSRTTVDEPLLEDVCWSSDARILAVTRTDGSVELRDASRGYVSIRRLPPVGTKGATRCAFSPDGGKLLAGNRDGSASLWETRTWTALSLQGHTAAVWAVAFSTDGRWALTGGYDERAFVWDASSGKALNRFDCRHGPVRSLQLDPQGELLAVASADHGIDVFEAAPPGQLLDTLHDPTMFGFTFSGDGRQLITTSPRGAYAWDVSLEERSPAEVAHANRCSLPLLLQGEVLVALDEAGRGSECQVPSVRTTR